MITMNLWLTNFIDMAVLMWWYSYSKVNKHVKNSKMVELIGYKSYKKSLNKIEI